jgi:hypothetical protein
MEEENVKKGIYNTKDNFRIMYHMEKGRRLDPILVLQELFQMEEG